MNQKGFFKIVIGVIAVLLLIIIGGYFVKNQQVNQQVGDSPSYTKLSSCSEAAQFVIRAKAFPENLIHSCKTSQYTVNGDKFNVVEVEYGLAQDCPSGCFYDFFISAVPVDQQTFFELPGTSGDSKNYILTTAYNSLPQYNFSKIDFNCKKELDSLTTMELTKHNGQIGWQFTLVKPYICSWKEVKSTRITMDNTSVHTADEVTQSWNGTMFVSLMDSIYRWNLDDLETVEISREEITFEERF